MSPWVFASLLFMVALAPCGVMVFRGRGFDRLVGLELATIVIALALMTICEAFGRGSFVDLALALALLSLGASLVFVRTMERWL